MQDELAGRIGHRLLFLGVLLFLFGLITGLLPTLMENPRMGLTSHLEGLMNGTFLAVLGLIWPKLNLSPLWHGIGFWSAIIGGYTNWLVTLLAGFWGAGGAMMPIAAPGREGAGYQEMIVGGGLILVTVTMILASVIVLVGLRRKS